MERTPEMERLEQDLSASPELRDKLAKARERIAAEGQVKNDVEIFEKAAAELGYQITAAEVERFYAEKSEVDDSGLEMVAGGYQNWPDKGGCGIDYYCIVFWK